MEAEINSFTRKSKKYRTKYFDQLDKLFGEAAGIKPVDHELRSQESKRCLKGQDKDRV